MAAEPHHEHIGDGVYVSVDDMGQIVLRVGSHESIPRVYMEPEVVNRFQAYVERLRKEKVLR